MDEDCERELSSPNKDGCSSSASVRFQFGLSLKLRKWSGWCGHEWRSVDVCFCENLYCTTDGLSVCVCYVCVGSFFFSFYNDHSMHTNLLAYIVAHILQYSKVHITMTRNLILKLKDIIRSIL